LNGTFTEAPAKLDTANGAPPESRSWDPDQLEANRPYGEKGNYRKITVTLPPDAYRSLIEEAARRKIADEPNHLLSAILREAVAGYLQRLESDRPQRSPIGSSRKES
jgi:hypothetical protein